MFLIFLFITAIKSKTTPFCVLIEKSFAQASKSFITIG